MSRIVTYVHRYKSPPRRRKPPTIRQVIVHTSPPKRLAGKIVRADRPNDGKTPTRIIHIESPRARWLRRMLER